MALSKAEGLVLGGIKFGETSKIITLYTKELGKLTLMVKGARNPHRRLASTLQFLSHIGIVIYLKEGRGLQFLSQAHLINPFWEIKGDLDRFCAASAGAEFISRLQIGQESHPDLFALLMEFLGMLESINHRGLKPLLISFLLQASQLLGYGLSLSRCIHCKRKILDGEEGDLLFSPEGGGVVCRKCARGNGYYLKPSMDLVKTLRALSSGLGKAIETDSYQFDFKTTYKLLNPFWEFYAPGYRSLQSLEVWREVKGTEAS
jgi:DNA repair protein RecO (recombination protein O)